MWRQMEPSWDVSRYEKFVLDLQTPPPQQPRAQMSVEDQHEWLEARRVTLMAHMELALAAHDAVPQGLLDEWCRLQRARDTLLRHRICRDNWPLYLRELGRLGRRLRALLRWTVCDSWDVQQLGQLSSDWLLVAGRLHGSGYHSHHSLPVHSLLDTGLQSAAPRPPCTPPPPTGPAGQFSSPGRSPAHGLSPRTLTPACRRGQVRSRTFSPAAGHGPRRRVTAAETGQGCPTRPATLARWLTSPDRWPGRGDSWRRTSSYLTP
ncbi:uncharacterized protein LOC122394426 [Amphibalanus amphitrite]|uniref:uncharacterized protein LOC122394426 n=1 Tax=Amphibalanus amphitrite TaxID=1232801 RepID=UPI001C903B47|nr:uncharacterized protein LOC122394426 [Amphibalanus amphitrite]